MKRSIIDVLKERGFIEAITSEEIRSLTEHPVKVYCGFDPTADSLHLGNLVAMMGLAWFQRFGHTPVAIIGGATGMIGDPSGKASARQFLDESTLEFNAKGIKRDLEKFLSFSQEGPKPLILNNYDWYKNVSFIQFLRDFGALFRLGPMLSKESVKQRLQSEEGLSFTEFSYQILQGYDFLHLMQQHGVSIQIGGSDQWGNITSGTELIRRVLGESAYGITFPLLTKSDGQKFGKSEKGAIWLSADKLSPYEFYQHLIRVEDTDVIKLMRMLTFMEMDEIRYFEKLMQEPDYLPRTAQKKLAEEVTCMIHGKEALNAAQKVTEGLAPGASTALDAEMLQTIAADMRTYELPEQNLLGVKLVDLLVTLGLQTSKSEARRSIKGGGVYMNNQKIEDDQAVIEPSCLIEGQWLLLSIGKKNKVLVRLS